MKKKKVFELLTFAAASPACHRHGLLSVLKIVILMLVFKINMPKTETTVNLKSASFVVIMLLHEHIQSQIKPRLL